MFLFNFSFYILTVKYDVLMFVNILNFFYKKNKFKITLPLIYRRNH